MAEFDKIEREPLLFKNAKTKLVCTIGPASSRPAILKKLIKNGLNVVRINFSHGSYNDYETIVNNVRKISQSLKIYVAILQDLQGPKLRIGEITNGQINIKKGQEIIISTKKEKASGVEIPCSFDDLPQYVKKDEKILIDDGNLQLEVLKVKKNKIHTKVIVGGILKSNKGINLPYTELNIPALTEKDKEDIKFGIEYNVDYIALSFVQKAKDIQKLKNIIKDYNKTIPVIAKIEKPTAIKNLDSIIDVSDGLMVARGDLGVEMMEEKIPVLQKEIIRRTAEKGKIVITATQMLESMIKKPRPTRAETTDVSNAIIDLTDAVMLSGETAIGKYPVKAAQTIKKIAGITENSRYFDPQISVHPEPNKKVMHSIVKSAVKIAEEVNARVIIALSWSGATALMLSKYRPRVPIIAFSPDKKAIKRMTIYWGVNPNYLEFKANTDQLIEKAENILINKKIIQKGDSIVMIGGTTPIKGATNMLRVIKI